MQNCRHHFKTIWRTCNGLIFQVFSPSVIHVFDLFFSVALFHHVYGFCISTCYGSLSLTNNLHLRTNRKNVNLTPSLILVLAQTECKLQEPQLLSTRALHRMNVTKDIESARSLLLNYFYQFTLPNKNCYKDNARNV